MTVFSFLDAFPHHVNFVWMVANRVPQNLKNKDAFRDYIRGFQPRATFPHHETIHRIAECIDELQDEDQQLAFKNLQEAYRSQPCLGIQLDLWTDTSTHTSYGSISASHIQKVPRQSTSNAGVNTFLEAFRLVDEVIAFEAFPKTEHTAQNLKDWILDVLERQNIKTCCISGITPDGASDGQAALDLAGLSHLVDTCLLHQLQRGLLYSVGLAGSEFTRENNACRALLMKHRRQVQLHNQCRAVSEGIRKAQAAIAIPAHKVLAPEQTHAIRWGAIARQVTRNLLLKPLYDPVMLEFKKMHRSKPDEIVCVDEVEGPGGKLIACPVKSSAVGLSLTEWEDSRSLDSFLEHCLQTKEMIEDTPNLHAGQALVLLLDLKLVCQDESSLVSIKQFPKSASMKDRKWRYEDLQLLELPQMVVDARKILSRELQERCFSTSYEERPSDSRLVLIFMSKQAPASALLSAALLTRAETLYLSMLRKAATINGIGLHSPPPRKMVKRAPGHGIRSSSLLGVADVNGEPEDDADVVLKVRHVSVAMFP